MQSDTVVLIVTIVAGLLHGAYVVFIGGDHMHGRMLLPAAFTILIPFNSVRLDRRADVTHQLALLAIVIWAIHYALGMRISYRLNATFADEREWWTMWVGARNPVLASNYRGHLPLLFDLVQTTRRTGQPRALELDSIGVYGFVGGPSLTVIDRYSLADPVGSRLRLTQRSRAGHEKPMPKPWIIARYGARTSQDPGVQAAREALGCVQLAELVAGVQSPLTPARFVKNIGLALKTARMRIPPDPFEARAHFCGSFGTDAHGHVGK